MRELGFFDYPISDGRVYVNCARAIASGQWGCPSEFVHAPLYAYFLAVVRGLFGDGLLAPRVAQLALGVLSCLLLYRAMSRWFSSGAGLAAALLLALYPPAIFFDLLIQKTSLGVFLVVALLWAMAAWRERPTVPRALVCGTLMGLLIHVQQALLLAAPIVPAFLLVGRRASRWSNEPHGRAGNVAFSAAGAAAIVLMLAPWVIRNRVVVGEWVLTTPNLGQNFFMGNDPAGRGTYRSLRLGRGSGEFEQREWTREAHRALGRPLSPGEVSDYYFSRAVERIRESPGRWAMLLGRKMHMTLGATEWMDAEDYYVYTQRSAILRWLDRVFHFGVLLPLAAIGFALTARRARELWPLYLWLIATALAMVAFVVFGRYRFPMIPVLVGFAAAGLVIVLNACAKSRLRASGESTRLRVVVACMFGFVIAIASNRGQSALRQPSAIGLANHAMALSATGRLAEAQRDARRAVDVDLASADAWLILADVLRRGGQLDEALAAADRAAVLAPNEAAAQRARATALIDAGRLEEAEAAFRRALTLDESDALALAGVAGVMARTGRAAEALPLFEQALNDEPDNAEGLVNYGNTLVQLGRAADAEAAYRSALEHDPRSREALLNLAILEMNRDRPAGALARLEALEQLESPSRLNETRDAGAATRRGLASPEAQALRLTALVQLGRLDEARAEAQAILAAEPGRDEVRRLLRAMDVAAGRATTQRATTPQGR